MQASPWLPYLSTGWTSSLREILEWLREIENVTRAYIHKAVSNKWVNYPFKMLIKGIDKLNYIFDTDWQVE